MAMTAPLSMDRLVIEVLKDGVAELRADATLFDALLGSYPATERARARTRFLERSPTIRPAFARPDDPWPTWSVVLGSEEETEGALAGLIAVDATLGAHGSEVLGALEDQEVRIFLCCEHPDETRLHHLLAKAIMRGHLIWFLQQGVTGIAYGTARDLHPEETYLPETVFVRMQSWEFKGVSVAFRSLGAPKTKVWAFMEDVTVDGHVGKVHPEHR